MASSAVRRPPRGGPRAIVYVGVPAFLVVIGFSLRDIVRSQSAAVSVAAIVAIAVYAVIFLVLVIAPPTAGSERANLTAIAVLAVLATVLAFLGATQAVFLITVSALAGDRLPPRFAIPIIVLATAGILVYSVAYDYGPQNTVTDGSIGLVVGLFAYGFARLSETNRELVDAREELALLAVAHERLRFARDLHDLLGHTLTAIRAKSELASRLAVTDPARAGREMVEVETVARQALAEVREAVGGYRRPTLAAEMTNARAALEAAGIAADLAAVDGLDLRPEIDETLGWVLREAVTNVVRHSRARRCHVAAAWDGAGVCLEVADDGLGLGQSPSGTTGSGLIGVRERLAAVGGTVELGQAQGGGLRVVARVPRAP